MTEQRRKIGSEVFIICGGWKSARLQLQISLLFSSFYWPKGSFESEYRQILGGSNLISPQKAARVLSCSALYIFPCPFHQEFTSNYAFSLLFFAPVFVSDAETTQRDPRKRPAGRIKSGCSHPSERSMDWKPACMRFCVSVWDVNVCSWKEIMSVLHTCACFLLWISFAAQDKTPGETQTPLCSFTGIKRLTGFITEPDTRAKSVKKKKQ